MPVAARRHLNDLPDELWIRLKIEFHKDATDAVFKALEEQARSLGRGPSGADALAGDLDAVASRAARLAP